MKFLILLCAVVAVAMGAQRSRRQAYNLPDGVDMIVGPIKTTFACGNDGYYADVDNNCQIFHVCHTSLNGMRQQWSFACGNQTVFNQLSLTCADPYEAVPCNDAPSFFSINDRINAGDPNLYFLTDDDINKAAPLIPGLYAKLYSGAEAVRPGRG